MTNKEVRFDIFCKYCKHRSKTSKDEPCTDCLGVPARETAHHPEYFDQGRPMVYFFQPDDKDYTLDLRKAHNWDEMPTESELKKYFELSNGNWYEKEVNS